MRARWLHIKALSFALFTVAVIVAELAVAFSTVFALLTAAWVANVFCGWQP